MNFRSTIPFLLILTCLSGAACQRKTSPADHAIEPAGEATFGYFAAALDAFDDEQWPDATALIDSGIVALHEREADLNQAQRGQADTLISRLQSVRDNISAGNLRYDDDLLLGDLSEIRILLIHAHLLANRWTAKERSANQAAGQLRRALDVIQRHLTTFSRPDQREGKRLLRVGRATLHDYDRRSLDAATALYDILDRITVFLDHQVK